MKFIFFNNLVDIFWEDSQNLILLYDEHFWASVYFSVSFEFHLFFFLWKSESEIEIFFFSGVKVIRILKTALIII